MTEKEKSDAFLIIRNIIRDSAPKELREIP